MSYSWANPLQGSAFNYDPAFPLADSMTFSNLANGGVYNFSLKNNFVDVVSKFVGNNKFNLLIFDINQNHKIRFLMKKKFKK